MQKLLFLLIKKKREWLTISTKYNNNNYLWISTKQLSVQSLSSVDSTTVTKSPIIHYAYNNWNVLVCSDTDKHFNNLYHTECWIDLPSFVRCIFPRVTDRKTKKSRKWSQMYTFNYTPTHLLCQLPIVCSSNNKYNNLLAHQSIRNRHNDLRAVLHSKLQQLLFRVHTCA